MSPRWFSHWLAKTGAGIIAIVGILSAMIPTYEFYEHHRDAHFRQIMREELESYDQRHDYEHRITVIETEIDGVREWADKQGHELPHVKPTSSNRGSRYAKATRPALPHN